MTTKSKVPQIRFKSFNEQWNEKKFDEVIDALYNGQTPSRAVNSYWNGQINWLSSGELNRSVVTKAIEKITPAGLKNANLRIVPKGTFVMAITGLEASGTRGNCGILGIDTTLNQSCMAIYPNLKQLHTPFLFQWYRKNSEEYGLKFTQGTKQQSYNAEIIKKLDIILPKVDEQTKIGDYFQQLDKLIEKKEKKYQKLKQFKKAMLDKMFPKNEANTPEIRFKGFSGKWEEKKLGQLAKITTGSSNRQDSGLDGKYTFFDRSDDIRTSNIYLFDGEAVIVAGEGSDFVPKYFKGKFDLHQRTYAIMNFENGDSKFLFYYIHLFRKWFLNQAVGSTVKSLRLPMFQEMVIKYPRKEEQEKIGNYFQKLDNQIDLQQKELEKLKNIKKASLSKMFV